MHLAGDAGVVEVVRDGGRFVSTLVMSPDQVPTATAVVVPVFGNPTSEVLERVVEGVAAGSVAVAVDRVFPLEQASDALEAFRQGKLGKIAISVD